jgi:drug/metabolite transporter (DMT)-like permease
MRIGCGRQSQASALGHPGRRRHPGTTPASGDPRVSPHAIGSLFAVIGVICFSIRPVLVRLVYAYDIDPTTLLALRLGLSLPAFAAVAIWFATGPRRVAVTPRDWLQIVAIGLIGHYVASWLDMAGLQYVNAGLGRLILFLYPTIVLLLSAGFLGKRIGAREIAALASSYAGLALVLLPSADLDGQDVLRGALLIFGGAAAYAVYLVAASQVIGRVGGMVFSANANIAAFVASTIHFLLADGPSLLDLPLPVYGYAGLIAVISTILPVFIVAEALRRVGANQVALIGAVGPVTTLLLGTFGLGETMTRMELLGAALILGGVMIVTVKPEAKRQT